MDYLEALGRIHAIVDPATYVEIGCHHGISLSLARCPTVGIDPDFEIRRAFHAPTRLYRETSDEFFAGRSLTELLGGPFDLAFVDGMHLAEYVVRDFLNLERHAHPGSVVVIDDVLPDDMAMATRDRQGIAWTGDVYRAVSALRERRPDLVIDVFDVELKGLALVTNLAAAAEPTDYEAIERDLLAGRFVCASIGELRAELAPRPAEELDSVLRGSASRSADHSYTSSGAAGRDRRR